MSENVSDEALGIRESGSSYKSSVQVPPLTGVPPPVEGGGVLGAPHALNQRISSEQKDKTISRERGLDLLGIRSSSVKYKLLRGSFPTVWETWRCQERQSSYTSREASARQRISSY